MKDPTKQIPLIKNWFNFGKPIWTQSKNPVLEGWFGCIKTEIPKKRLKKTSWSTVLQYTEARRSQQEPIGARLFWVEPLQFYAFFFFFKFDFAYISVSILFQIIFISYFTQCTECTLYLLYIYSLFPAGTGRLIGFCF